MTGGTVLSRVTGLARLAAVTAALGVVETRLADTYNFGNTAPNIIYEFLLGGILTSVFVPVFVELLEKEGRDSAWEVGSAIINLSLLFLGVMTVLGIFAAPMLARFYEVDVPGQQRALTFLLRLFIPQIMFYALAAITAGLLNAHKRFGPPMYTPILNNLTVIAIFLYFASTYGEIDLASVTTGQLILIGAGTTLGVAVMALGQLPFLRGLGHYRLTFSVSHPSVRKLAGLSVFVVGYVMANQVGYLIVQRLARGEKGAYTAYVAAFTLFQLPYGLFAVSVITALLPNMSELAVHQRWDDFRARLSDGLRATLFLILPAAVGYVVLGAPIVRLLLQNGITTSQSTELVASVLRFFVLGLVPFSLFQLLLRAFYATQDTRTPFMVNCAAVGINIAANIVLFGMLGVQGLAVGHAIGYSFGVIIQGLILSRRIGGLEMARFGVTGAKIATASAGMGVAVWAAYSAAESIVATDTLTGQASAVLAPVLVGVVAYGLLAYLLRIEELEAVRSLLRRRIS